MTPHAATILAKTWISRPRTGPSINNGCRVASSSATAECKHVSRMLWRGVRRSGEAAPHSFGRRGEEIGAPHKPPRNSVHLGDGTSVASSTALHQSGARCAKNGHIPDTLVSSQTLAYLSTAPVP